MSDSVRPHRWQPTRLPRPWDSPGKNTGAGCHFLLQCMKVKSLSRVRPSATPWTAAYQVPSSMGFSRQEYWSGVPLPSPENEYTNNPKPMRLSRRSAKRKVHSNTSLPQEIGEKKINSLTLHLRQLEKKK